MFNNNEICGIIGKNIKNARLMRNYSQDYVAACLQISQNAYSKIEIGKSNVSVERAFKIAQILEVSFEDLIIGTHREYSVYQWQKISK
jgi:transcriptional regulator with XRE-family HTH domain